MDPTENDLGRMAIDLQMATFNELSRSYLWDWVCTHLRMLAVKRGWGEYPRCALVMWPRYSERHFATMVGGAKELVDWILSEEARGR